MQAFCLIMLLVVRWSPPCISNFDPVQTLTKRLTLEGVDAWIHGRLRGSHHLHCQEMRRASSRSLRDAKKSLESLYGGFLRRGDDFMMILCEFDPQIIQVIGWRGKLPWKVESINATSSTAMTLPMSWLQVRNVCRLLQLGTLKRVLQQYYIKMNKIWCGFLICGIQQDMYNILMVIN